MFKMTSLIDQTQRSPFSGFANTIWHIVVSISLTASSISFLWALQYFKEHLYIQYSWDNSAEKNPEGSNLGYEVATCKFVFQKILP